MKDTDLNRALKGARVTQSMAAELLGIDVSTVSRRATGAFDRAGELQFVAAVWPELDDDARDRVRQRLAEMRRACAAETA